MCNRPRRFIFNPDIDFETATMVQAIKAAAGDAATDIVDGTGLASTLMGDSIATNLFMLGYAFQKGLVPLSFGAIERAIELNGVSVENNKRSFAWGRLAADDRGAGRGAGAARAARRYGAATAVASTLWSTAAPPFSQRLPGCGLCAALP